MKTTLLALALLCSACTTPAGKRAANDTAIIAKNAQTVDHSATSALDRNRRIQDLNNRIDAKDRVIQGTVIDP